MWPNEAREPVAAAAAASRPPQGGHDKDDEPQGVYRLWPTNEVTAHHVLHESQHLKKLITHSKWWAFSAPGV